MAMTAAMGLASERRSRQTAATARAEA